MITIELMRNSPVITQGDHRVVVDGTKKVLFRLLVLNNGKTVTKSDIAAVKNTSIDAVSAKVRDLKEGLGTFGGLIKNNRGVGYMFDNSDCNVDALSFKNQAKAFINGNVDWGYGSITIEEAFSELRLTEKALELWRANPADNLPQAEFGFEAEFSRYREIIETRQVFAMLHTRDHEHINDAITLSEKIIRHGASNARIAIWLMLAYDAIGVRSKVIAVRNRLAVEYQDMAAPADIEDIYQKILENKIINPFRPENVLEGLTTTDTRYSKEVSKGVVEELCSEVGITGAYEMQLEDSKLSPSACIDQATTRLWFSGVLASKWVIDPAVRSRFQDLLSTFEETGSDAKFLIINPAGEAFERLKGIRQGHLSDEPVEHLRQLNQKYDSLEVRLYNSLPSFRIVIIDENVVSFSPYRLAADPYLRSKRGWKAPHVVLDPRAPYPLAEAFELLFLETWRNAIPLEST